MKRIVILLVLLINTLFSKELDIKFSSNSYMIEESQIERVNNYVDFLFTNHELSVVIEAHTDSLGSEKENLELSAKRANTIKNYIVSKGILQSRVDTLACGESKPKVSNDTKENRQINRRVEAKTFVTFE